MQILFFKLNLLGRCCKLKLTYLMLACEYPAMQLEADKWKALDFVLRIEQMFGVTCILLNNKLNVGNLVYLVKVMNM